MTVIPLRPRLRRTYCTACGIEFRPAATHHTRCATCWRWSRIGYYIAATRRMIAEAAR